MSYKSNYSLLVHDDKYVTANLDEYETDHTAIPVNMSVIRRSVLDHLYRQLAAQSGAQPEQITEAQLIAAFGLVDEREKTG